MIDLPRYEGEWDEDDPHAAFKADVALHTLADPLPTMENLSRMTGVPVPALVRYALVRWTSEGAEAILHAGPAAVLRMSAVCQDAEAEGTDEARLAAYAALRGMISWLAVPLEQGPQG